MSFWLLATPRRRFGTYVGAAALLGTAAAVAAASDAASDSYSRTTTKKTTLWHVAHGMQRTARAVAAGARCVVDYRILAWRYPREDDNAPLDPAYEDALALTHERCAARLVEAFRKNGGIYAKLGQHIASLSHLVPAAYVDAMRVLHDRCPESVFADLEAMFVEETGNSFNDIFATFDRVPVGVASLAQVHSATTRDGGRRVAVKLQHPEIREFSTLDIWITARFARFIKATFPDFQLDWLAREMEKNLPIELDFRNEAKNAARVQKNFDSNPTAFNSSRRKIKIPRVEWATPRVLCMEFIDGFRVDDSSALQRSGVNNEHVNLEITRIFSDMIFQHGFVHADPHPGNILIVPLTRARTRVPLLWRLLRPSFEICVLDHGLYRELDVGFRNSYAALWSALFARDETRIRMASRDLFGGTRAGDELYGLLACMVSGRSWDSVISTNGGLLTSSTADETDAVRRDAARYARQIASVLARVPPALLLVFKTNDLLRDLRRRLNADERVAAIGCWYGVLRCEGSFPVFAFALDWLLNALSYVFQISLY